MFNNILIVGCGLIGSSILKSSIKNKISKNIYVYEKLKKNIKIIRKINKRIKFIPNLNKDLEMMNFIIILNCFIIYSSTNQLIQITQLLHQ